MKMRKILIAENQKEQALGLQKKLKSLKYSVVAIVNTGEKAVSKTKKDKPDLVLINVMLKGKVSGVEASDAIRTSLDIPVIYITSFSNKKMLDRAKITEPFGYLTSSCQPRELSAIIETALYRHQVKKRLKKSEELHRITLNSISDAVFITDKKGAFTFICPNTNILFGYSADEIQSMGNIKKLIDGRIFSFNALSSSGEIKNIEKEITNKAGEKRASLISVKQVAIDNGRVLFSCRDITERKQAEEALEKAHEDLERRVKERTANLNKANKNLRREIQERIRAEEHAKNLAKFPSENPNPVLRVSKNGTVLYANKASRPLLKKWKCKQGKLIPKTMARLMKEVRDSLTNKEIEVDCMDRIFLLQLVYLPDTDYINIYGYDITERKMMEGEILKVQRLESLGVIAGGIAHNFNNILTGFMGKITLAQWFIGNKKMATQKLKEAENILSDAKELANQLLTFSKGGEPVKRVFAMEPIIKDQIDFLLSGSNVKSHANISDNLWPVEIDKGQIGQVLTNLILNAKEAMLSGGMLEIKGRNIHIKNGRNLPLQKGKYIKISFKDNGKGISSRNLTKIFDPYFSTKKEGTGLGLATSYSILKRHSGYIEAHSKIREGSTFTLYLPACDAKAVADDMEKGEINGRFKKRKILFLEDERGIREDMALLFELKGHDIIPVENGERAIKVYKDAFKSESPFDMVIMDLTIAGGPGGKAIIKGLLKIDPYVKAIVASGYSKDPIMANPEKFGFCGVLPKPYNVDDLNLVLHKVLGEL